MPVQFMRAADVPHGFKTLVRYGMYTYLSPTLFNSLLPKAVAVTVVTGRSAVDLAGCSAVAVTGVTGRCAFRVSCSVLRLLGN